MFFNVFEILILKIKNFKKIILIYFQIKNIFFIDYVITCNTYMEKSNSTKRQGQFHRSIHIFNGRISTFYLFLMYYFLFFLEKTLKNRIKNWIEASCMTRTRKLHIHVK
jgi:hypothetical protein